MTSIRLAPAGAVLLSLALAWVARTPEAAASDWQLVDRIAAVVGEEIVLLSDVRERADDLVEELKMAARAQGSMPPDLSRDQLLEQALDAIVADRLIAQQAGEMKIKVTTDEVDRAIKNLAKENGIDLETFRQAVEARGKDMATYRSEVRRDLLKYKVLNLRIRGRVQISEIEARQYYNDQVRDVRATGTFEGAHILVRVPPGARAAEVAAHRKRADEILRRIRAGEDFAAVARAESEDAVTAPRGGSLGKLEPGTIPATLDRAFLDMEPGEISGPVRTPAGFHLIKLNSREALGVQPFAEVKNRIVAQLTQQEMIRQERIWLEELELRTFIDSRL